MNQSIDSFRCKGHVERSRKKEVGRPVYDLGWRQNWQQSNKGPHRVYMLRIECGKALVLDLPIPVADGGPTISQVSSSSVARKSFITPGSHQLID
jgi:hypothetical protein